MRFEKGTLMGFLKRIDKELGRRIKLIAVGGTAMTLLDLKPSTIDVDFDLKNENAEELESALKAIPHGFKIDIFREGMIFSQQLPEDHFKKSILIKTGFKNIMLYALHPLDIVVTKIGRLNERDLQDIKACIEKFGLTKEQIEKRAEHVEYVGREENYTTNLRHVLIKFFD
jgi:hypothetical protein